MKKKFREIEVDGEEYAWRVASHVDDANLPYNKLTVWEDKKILFTKDYKDGEAVTPKTVSNEIRNFVENMRSI